MSTVERKEYQETKVLRTVSPVRNFRTSNQNLAQFDSNLDHLLEDLQNSVSRPGSSLGHNYTSSRTNTLDKSSTLNRLNVKAANPVTEYSSDDTYSYMSPDGRKQVSGYKKETYSSYKSGAGGKQNYNQLDSLLDDLQQVKQPSYEKESYNSAGASPTFQRKNVNRELHYGDTPRSGSRSRTLERSEQSSRDVQYTSEGTYGDLRPLRTASPSSRSSTLSRQTKVTNVKDYPIEVVKSAAPDIDPEVLAHLDPNLRPPGNTKVTTTIKTYTYEIPGSGDYATNLNLNTAVDEKYVYSPNESQTTPSKSFVYNKIENTDKTYKTEPNWQTKRYKETVTDITDNINYNYPAYKKPSSPGGTLVKETVTTRQYQPGYSPELDPPTSKQTYIYNESKTTKNINQNGYPSPQLPRKDTYVYKESHNTTNVDNRPYQNGHPPNEPNKTVIYKHETHTTNNYGPGNRPKTPTDAETFDIRTYARPKDPINIHYKYKTTNTSSSNYKGGYPPANEPHLRPNKFPTDSEIIDSNPPKRLDDLMATMGHEPPTSPLNAGYLAHEQELAQQRKIDILKQQQAEAEEQRKEPVQRTRNVSGPPVYYPPGHEMFAKKEEEAAWRAEGGYAKASGKYEYEAKSKSKSKSSSGATVVPVCLPLCCGLPCALL